MSDVVGRLTSALADRYRIERELGQGGMATVYLAHDIKHDRKVALKVLKPELAAVLGAERFVVEIKTTAALQHPHILPLFDSGTADGFLFYVMPFIDGETLRAKLDRETQFGVDEAVRIAVAVADALDYAHRHGVIHRDIKPENILLHEGRPMVADFGIALALSAAAGGRMTETGLSLGTPHYMSPEQATAEKEISARSDIYSLASVLYEMLAGQPPHLGGSAQQIIMKIITETAPSVTTLRKSVPLHVAAALAKALEKLPADRFASAAEFGTALIDRGFTTQTSTAGLAHGATARSWRGWMRDPRSWAALVLVGALIAWALRPAPAARVIRVSVAFPDEQKLRGEGTRRFALSRDGTRMVYIGPSATGTQLWVRNLDELAARPLVGTEGAMAPFFSPDGNSVAFFTGNPGDVRTIPTDGGPVVSVVRDVASPWGGDWGDDGKIYFDNMDSRIARVAAEGGPVDVVSELDSARGVTEHDWPQLLPGGKKILIQLWHGSVADATIGVLDLETRQATEVVKAAYGRYVAGHLLYSTFDGQMVAVPFDVGKAAVTGKPVTLNETVNVDALSGSAQFDVSEAGVMVYTPGDATGNQQLVWVERSGKVVPVDTTWRGRFGSVSLSPDGSRLAVQALSAAGDQIWVKQLPVGPATLVTAGSGNNIRPAWMPDGRRLAYISGRGGVRGAFVQRSDASAVAESLLVDSRAPNEVQPTPDGRRFILRFSVGWDFFMLTSGADTALRPLLVGPEQVFSPDVSPDGRWLAYIGRGSGRAELYVRQLDDPNAGRVQVSIDGAEEPRWSHSGKELFFRSSRGEMLVADVTAGTAFAAGPPRVLFSLTSAVKDYNHRAYDITRDDRRFLMISAPEAAVVGINLVSDWLAALKTRRTGVRR
jgi:serine/threonine-protein kinase